MNPFKAIYNALKVAVISVKSAFVKVFGSAAADAFADYAEELFRTALGKIALQVVTELVAVQMAGRPDKVEEAFKRIAEAAKLAGIEAKDHLIYQAIETAVTYLKNHAIEEE